MAILNDGICILGIYYMKPIKFWDVFLKQDEIVHLKDILKIDKKGVINNKTFQNFVEFIQWIPTKHIPTFRIVRIVIFFYCFLALKMASFAFFQI